MQQLVQPALIDGEERVPPLPTDLLHLSFRRRGAPLSREWLCRSEWQLDPAQHAAQLVVFGGEAILGDRLAEEMAFGRQLQRISGDQRKLMIEG